MFARTVSIIGLLICFQVVGCADEGSSLKFPDDRNCGTVSIGSQPTVSEGWTNFHESRKRVGPARGTVTVPIDAFVELEVNRTGSKDLGFLSALPQDKIHFLTLTGGRLGPAEFASLGRFTSLKVLVLTDCELSPDVNTHTVVIAPALQSLIFLMTDEESRKKMPVWASRCSKLEELYDRSGAIDVTSLRLFRNHPSIHLLTVDFGTDVNEVTQALNEMPRLRSLNVRIKDEGYEQYLSRLKTVENINWNDGSIDERRLKAIGQMPALRRIRFQGDCKILSDFPKGLAHLPLLEELNLNCDRSECPEERLQSALCLLKNLRGWPGITNPSKRTLAEISTRHNLKRFEIRGLGSDATTLQIATIIESNPLKSLTLKDIAFTPELGDALSKCSTLEALFLNAGDFDGNSLRHPERLVNLARLEIFVVNGAYNLMPLSQLPKLQSLSLNTTSIQLLDYGFIASCRSLTAFDTHLNFVNDQAIEQIAQSRILEDLILGPNCVATDAGLKRIAQCRQLKRLSIGGNVGVYGIRQLDQIPDLRRLVVSGLLTNEDREKLKEHFADLNTAHFSEFDSPYGRLVIGSDGIWRTNDKEGRKEMDVLEGRGFRELMGPSLTESIDNDLRGKVILVDFWGTWCGPCLGLMPELQRMREIFGKDRFEILGIHSQDGVETLESFLKNNPKPWPNIGDPTGELARTFSVPHYPSIYLFDRQGKLRVAQPHRLGLEPAIQKLLLE